MGLGFNTSFTIFQIMFLLVFISAISMFILVAVRNFKQWNKNNHSPRLTVPATVVAKRTNISHHHHNHSTGHSTTYHVTFQVESGDRMELYVAGHEFGMLIEGDRGMLTFQGTRYLSFQRQ